MQNDQCDLDKSKRKRQKSTDSDQNVAPQVSRSKNRKRAKSSDSEPKEDGEISDDNDSEDDLKQTPQNHPISQRKQIVYEIDDDSCSSSASGRNSPYSAFSGEQLTQFKWKNQYAT